MPLHLAQFGDFSMDEPRTFGQKVHQWLTNLTILIPLLSALGLGTLYGNSDTVRNWVHDSNNSPLTVKKVTPEIEPVNYDRIIKELIELNQGQDEKIDVLDERINKLNSWHE